MKPKLPAFTITETVVAMIISGLMVVMAAFTWNAFGTQFLQFRNGSEQLMELEKLRTVLQLDMERSVICRKNTIGLSLTNENNSNVDYRFGNHVIRTYHETVDTFKLAVYDWHATYTSRETSTEFFDQLNLVIGYGEVQFPLQFNKEYDALSKMWIEADLENAR